MQIHLQQDSLCRVELMHSKNLAAAQMNRLVFLRKWPSISFDKVKITINYECY